MESLLSPDLKEQVAANAQKVWHHILSRISKFPTPTGLQTYSEKQTDIVITTYPKSGTTLVQYLAYQVLVQTGTIPEADFVEINEVAPWVDWWEQMGTPLPTSSPRLLKSHSPKSVFDDAGKHVQKHVVVIRNPLDFPSSYLDFVFDAFTDDFADKRTVNDNAVKRHVFDLVARVRLLDENIADKAKDSHSLKSGWFTHTYEWTQPKLFRNVLVLFYEDIVKDLTGTAKKIARFAGVEITEEQACKVAKQCSRDKMANDSRFECHSEAKVFMFQSGVRKSMGPRTSGFKAFKMSDEIRETVNQRFEKFFGVDDYVQFREKINQIQSDMYGR